MAAILRKYNAATTILFPLIDAGAQDFESTPVTFATGDTQVSKDEGAFANTGSNPAHEGNGIYSLALTATEMQAGRIVITVIDQTATKEWEDQAILIETYGNASAQHAVDLDDSVRAGLTALPNAAAEAAGGLYTRGTGAGQINQTNNGRVDTDVQSLAADSVTAAAIATDAIGSAELATTAVDEIRDAILDRVLSGNHDTADTPGALLQVLTDTLAELTGIADAPTTPTPQQALMLLYMWLRNDTQVTSTERRILNNAGTEIMDAVVSDDGTTLSQGQLSAP